MELRGGGVFANERAVLSRHVQHIVRLVDDLLDIARLARAHLNSSASCFSTTTWTRRR
jgi:hypothetical protein